ncbi:DNA primase [Capnocytophaga periodontitidis]|uniref:DNA primase n=1 Tax=Capnocytophaga periodontitidis TaxID=2795027 RepID=UPI0018E12190|nr:DNA primase [Capnocytophaga periodontitidis]MBI1667453.1 DNA primase [Capnocytophaga periodontitidis]
MIKSSVIDKLYEADLCQAIGRVYTDASYKIRNNGTAEGCSPFKNERTPSFKVSNVKNIWKDFGSGKGGTSIIDFVQAYKGVDFLEAVKLACETLNIPIEYEKETDEQKEKRTQKQSLTQILKKTAEIYRQNFVSLPPESEAKKYMLSRNFTDEIVDNFGIGYALAGLYEAFKEQAIVSDGEALGLLRKNNQGNYYDFFKGRIIFPICDKYGHCVGFGGRILTNDKKQPKYINSAESDLFDKSNLLYGFHLARNTIANTGEVYLVEGYTDVMRMHQIGFANTVATLGTALTPQHLAQLKKLCRKVIIFRDSDSAGQTAAERDLQLILQAGLFAELVVFPSEDKEDPDSIGQRPNAVELIKYSRNDAILHLIGEAYRAALDRYTEKHGESKKALLLPEDKKNLTELAGKLVGCIPDDTTREAYTEQLKEMFNVKITPKKEEKPKHSNNSPRVQRGEGSGIDGSLDNYLFPDEVEDPYLYKNEIIEYGLFQHQNRIYTSAGKEGKEYFMSISNFSIEIVQHMQDEKFPMKLIRICNIYGSEKIFDILSDKINSLPSFKNVVTSFGNYYFSGTPSQHERLLRYLFDRMGTGRKISILGWQTEGFWAWNNKIVIPQGEDIVLDKTGLFNYQKTCYYIPSANANYENNAFMYGAQKRFKSTDTSLAPPEYFRQMYKVHRSHAITAILFGIGAFYQDIIVSGTGFYPLLFLYGPASTGKDNLCEAVQSLMGIPQTAIQLEGGASTIKAQIREFSQFSNGISQLSEYKRGNPQIDGVLKGLWDRRGYKRGTIESPVATEEVPILSATILTGNDCPDAEALITRLLWEEMKQQEFDDEAKKQYNVLKDMCKKGISGMADFFIHKRNFFADKFLETYREAKRNFTKGELFKNVPSRITDNLSVLRAVFNIFKNDWIFPFTEEEMLTHFEIMVDSQRKKIETDSAANRFWDCILVCMRLTQGEALRMGINLREEGGYLSFNFSTVYSIVQRQWFIQYRENAPSKTELRRQIKEAESFVGEEKAVRINLTINSPTSAIKVNINKLPIRAELIAEIENQRLRGEVKDIQDDNNSFF